MSPTRVGLLASLLVLNACQAAAPVKAPRPTRSGEDVSAAASNAPAGPGRSPDANSSGGPLKAPPGQTVTFSGEIRVDASYLVAKGLGVIGQDGTTVNTSLSSLISDNGGNIIANHGGGLVSDKGSGVLSELGAYLISDAGAGLVGDAGGGLIGKTKLVGDAGGGLIANNGAGLVANNGGGLVANNGGGLVGKTKYDLLGLGLFAAGDLAVGTSLPAAGMQVLVMDMSQNRAVPVGLDAAGEPAYVVYADAHGRYTLHLPALDLKNVRVVSLVPGARDRRAIYSLVTPGAGADARTLDEDVALATRFLRGCMLTYLEDQVARHASVSESPAPGSTAAGFLDAFGPLLDEYRSTALAAGVEQLNPYHVRRLVQAFADAALAYADLATLTTSVKDTEWTGPAEPALPLVTTVLAKLTAAATDKLRRDPGYFANRPFLRDANARRAASGLPPYEIVKPADLGELIFNEYMATPSKRQQEKLRFVFADLGVPLAEYEHLRAAYAGIFLGLAQVLAGDEMAGAAAKRVLGEGTAHELALQQGETLPSPAPSPSATPPSAAWKVETLSGGAAGYQDGPLAEARFNLPAGIALGDQGTLYVADTGNHRIRSITTAGLVGTLAGGDAGFQDGEGAAARFSEPRALAFDAHRSPPVLYVAEAGGHRIRQVSFPVGGAPVVSTVAGDGTPGFVDGPGANARFAAPSSLALDSHGDLFVADTENHRVRKIAMADASHPVSTVVGTGGHDGFWVGDARQGALYGPGALAFDAAGRLLLAERHRIDRVDFSSPVPLLSVLAGNAWAGDTDGFWVNAQLDFPSGLAVDSQGRIAVVEEHGQRVRLASPADPDALTFVTVVGKGDPAASPLASPRGIAYDLGGRLVVADSEHHRLCVVTP